MGMRVGSKDQDCSSALVRTLSFLNGIQHVNNQHDYDNEMALRSLHRDPQTHPWQPLMDQSSDTCSVVAAVVLTAVGEISGRLIAMQEEQLPVGHPARAVPAKKTAMWLKSQVFFRFAFTFLERFLHGCENCSKPWPQAAAP